MSATRSAIGVVALWATFCVVLLAAGWLGAGRSGTASTGTGPVLALLQATGADGDGRLKSPPAPCPEAPVTDTKAAEHGADPETSTAQPTLRLRRPAWVAVVPLWPADALRWQRMEPALRLNPGHAPPDA